jgi:hypothetical protein
VVLELIRISEPENRHQVKSETFFKKSFKMFHDVPRLFGWCWFGGGSDSNRTFWMRNYLNINKLQRGTRGASGLGSRVGCDPEKFFCIFFSISELCFVC